MTKQQIIHHIAKRLEFLLNHSDGADRVRNQDKITEISLILREVTLEEDDRPASIGNTFYYNEPTPFPLDASRDFIASRPLRERETDRIGSVPRPTEQASSLNGLISSGTATTTTSTLNSDMLQDAIQVLGAR